MTATAAMVTALAEPTPKDEAKHRPGPALWAHKDSCEGKRCRETKDAKAHLQIAYVDARFVMDRLDSTVGPESWQDAYRVTPDGIECGIGINIEGDWVWKWDVGVASDIEPVKGAYSDAFKRAGVKWGIARDLYGDDSSSAGNGRSASSTRPPVTAGRAGLPARPAAHPVMTVEPDLFDDFGDEPTPIRGDDNSECPEHGVRWNGEWTDLWHRIDGGGFCRHPDNIKKERPKAGARR